MARCRAASSLPRFTRWVGVVCARGRFRSKRIGYLGCFVHSSQIKPVYPGKFRNQQSIHLNDYTIKLETAKVKQKVDGRQ